MRSNQSIVPNYYCPDCNRRSVCWCCRKCVKCDRNYTVEESTAIEAARNGVKE